MKVYPVCLIDLEERKTVVVGGGRVALRKIEGLLEAGARVKVISLEACPEIADLESRGKIWIERRGYQPGDLQGVFLAIAATDDPQVNAAIWNEGKQSGCLVNSVDDPEHSHFITPAVMRRGELAIAISTGGGSPALARRLRERIEALVGPEYGELAELLAELRPELLRRFAPGEARLQAALCLIDSELPGVLRGEGYAAGRLYALECLERLSAQKREAA